MTIPDPTRDELDLLGVRAFRRGYLARMCHTCLYVAEHQNLPVQWSGNPEVWIRVHCDPWACPECDGRNDLLVMRFPERPHNVADF